MLGVETTALIYIYICIFITGTLSYRDFQAGILQIERSGDHEEVGQSGVHEEEGPTPNPGTNTVEAARIETRI